MVPGARATAPAVLPEGAEARRRGDRFAVAPTGGPAARRVPTQGLAPPRREREPARSRPHPPPRAGACTRSAPPLDATDAAVFPAHPVRPAGPRPAPRTAPAAP